MSSTKSSIPALKPQVPTGYEPNVKNKLNDFKLLNIPPFNGDLINFFNYKTRLELFFEHADVLSVLNAPTLEQARLVSGFAEKDMVIRMAIVFSLGDIPMRRLNQVGTGWEIWNPLNLEYNRQDMASRYETWSKLMSYKYQGNAIAAHCDEIIGTFELLNAKGIAVPEGLKVCVLLFSFPPQFST